MGSNTFTGTQIKLLKEFYFHCLMSPVVHEERSAVWTLSFYTYETMENLILGEKKYKEAPHPPWLMHNPKYRNNAIIRFTNAKRNMFHWLKNNKHLADNLIMCEVGYGHEIVLAMMVKDWDEIRCYDQNPYMEKPLLDFFVNQKKLNLTFEQSSSNQFAFDEVDKKTIVLSNHTHISIGKWSERIRNNDNLIYVRDGKVVPQCTMPITVEECRAKLGRGFL